MTEYIAIRRGNPPVGATNGGIERIAGDTKARAVPNNAAMRKIGTAEVGLERA